MSTKMSAGIASAAAIGAVWWLFASDLPWQVTVLAIASLQYWLGPIVIYFTQRAPAQAALREVSPAEAEVSSAQRSRLETLSASFEGCGFPAPRCWLIQEDEITKLTGVVVLFQHPVTTDIGHLLVAGDRDAIVLFSRPRDDGSRLVTVGATLRSPWPPDREDDVLVVSGEPDAQRIWPIHRARVERDPRVVRERALGNPIAFQTALEMKDIETRVKSRYWQLAGGGRTLRPTWRGAFLMSLRLLAPGRQLADWRSRRALRRLDRVQSR
jgi:hypothetical protein